MNLAVFDIDGTLLDNLVGEDACYARALREQLALSTLDTNWERYAHVSDDGIATEAYARQFAQPLPAPQRAATIERFLELLHIAHHATPLTVMPGAAEMLTVLRGRGWAVGFATGAWRRAAEYKLAAAGMSSTRIPLATSEDGPARVMIVTQAIARAAAAFGVASFARVVAIGDGVWDVLAAHELELPFVGVGAGERAGRLRHAGASHVLPDYLDVELALRSLEAAQVPRAAF
jgi:phosphoglycolate phosphatase-like HAD superfamily hydrolase